MSAGVDPFPAKPANLLSLVSSSSDSDKSPKVTFNEILKIVITSISHTVINHLNPGRPKNRKHSKTGLFSVQYLSSVFLGFWVS